MPMPISTDADPSVRGYYPADGVIGQLTLDRFDKEDASEIRELAPQWDYSIERPQWFARTINDFPNEPYTVIEPIPVTIEKTAPQDFTASFHEADIAMSGESIEEALQNLAADILDVYELLRGEPSERLCHGPRQQLTTLRRFLREA